jgi:hypothetical protein
VLGKSGRGAGRCSEDGSKIGGVDFFLELEEGVTEAAPGDGEMQARKLSLIHCTVKIPGVSEDAHGRGKGQGIKRRRLSHL